ncbi:PREDICTED: etoposide-induced protein 2.4 homolog isoform X1 [Amphimedon queenslandica]|uniref:Uncharacterized protein n=1 Tax=Amphimedon queenslandica TaxID=400682 RepID=A0AAN0JIS3_AMPQE|nr:PREDICTED: etoposide-induced protein 2.4 homolog isoform X1 [Amphimedon queenslandica]|eukprot:XP_019856920.1 PREDICTED: etoposide-induced protein 2.4 homolog isoform X1 [Amphimedon queenslandica]
MSNSNDEMHFSASLSTLFFEGILSFLRGIKDVILGCVFALSIVYKNSKIRSKVGLSFILNGFILASSILLFEHVVLPVVLLLTSWTLGLFGKDLTSEQLSWLESLLSYTFTGLWMLPMFLICTPINSIWFREIAIEANDQAAKSLKKKPSRWNFKLMITDLLYAMAIEIVFTIQSTAVNFLPVGGSALSLIHMSFLYSLYSFEYKWFYQGITVQKRLSYIELQWPYFLGFGLVLSLITSAPLLSPFGGSQEVLRHTVGNTVLGTCVFALAFPLMILASFSCSAPQINFYRLPVFKLSRLTCNKAFSLLLPSPSSSLH